MASIANLALRVKEDASFLINPAVVAEACAEADYEWRDRVLDPASTIEVFATQIAHGNTAIAHVAQLYDHAFSEAAYCEARRRLPLSVFRGVVGAATETLVRAADRGGERWNGHRVRVIDGTGCDMPEAPSLVAHFGYPPNQIPGCGFPVANVLPLLDLHTGMILNMRVSPYGASAVAQMPLMVEDIARNDILVGDREFGPYVLFALILERGAHLLARANSNRVIPYPAPTERGAKYTYNRHRHKVPCS